MVLIYGTQGSNIQAPILKQGGFIMEGVIFFAILYIIISNAPDKKINLTRVCRKGAFDTWKK